MVSISVFRRQHVNILAAILTEIKNLLLLLYGVKAY
jgi:hypothetical protein